MQACSVSKTALSATLVIATASSIVSGGALEAPPGMFKDLNDVILGDAILVDGKQLFIDDHIIEDLENAEKVLHQPVKHESNPVLEAEGRLSLFGSVLYDKEEQLFKMWYELWFAKTATAGLGYATSSDGVRWTKPIVSDQDQNNLLSIPQEWGFGGGAGIFKDPLDPDPERRYKMLHIAQPDGTPKSLGTNAAYSPDGMHWTAEPSNPIIPLSDTQISVCRDDRLGRYVAYLRYGPPNTRAISRIESEDFVHWSPKVTVFPPLTNKLDIPRTTKLYGMRVMPYEGGVNIGLLTAYHGETISKIPSDKEAWMDKGDVQLTFSRNGLTWKRVGKNGAITPAQYEVDRDWQKASEEATFIPWGRHKVDWDWGQIYAFQGPVIAGDRILFYYAGAANRHWATHHGDTRSSAIGLATLRLDGFVSINAEKTGTMTTKTFVFVGDTLEVNANAANGSITVEAIDTDGRVIDGFSKDACQAMTTDSVRHVLAWQNNKDCHRLQARPIKLRFYLEKAQLYSFTPRTSHTHYVPSYD